MNLQKLIDLLVENFGVEEDELTEETSLIDDLGFDSLDAVELSMAIEEEFGKNIPDADLESLKTLGDILKYLNENA